MAYRAPRPCARRGITRYITDGTGAPGAVYNPSWANCILGGSAAALSTLPFLSANALRGLGVDLLDINLVLVVHTPPFFSLYHVPAAANQL
jgi:hypothetical protein